MTNKTLAKVLCVIFFAGSFIDFSIYCYFKVPQPHTLPGRICREMAGRHVPGCEPQPKPAVNSSLSPANYGKAVVLLGITPDAPFETAYSKREADALGRLIGNASPSPELVQLYWRGFKKGCGKCMEPVSRQTAMQTAQTFFPRRFK